MLDTSLIKLIVIEETDDYGKYEIEPLERGYSQTIGNSLRRVLLSSLKGAAITGVKINGVKHEYATLAGLDEDILNVVLNLKQLKIRSFSDEPQTLYLNIKKTGEVKAGDLEIPASLEILNKDLTIATVTESKNALSMEITVETGVGYQNVESKRGEIGFIPVDANFSPIERVNFQVGSARLGQVTDLDKLTLEIYTKAIKPSDALHQALDIYTQMLSAINAQIVVSEVEEAPKAKKATKKASKK